MIKKRLLAVQGPLQFVAGYIAMDWFGKSQPAETQYETVLLMYDFLMPASLEAEFAAAIERLAAIGSWHKMVLIKGARMKTIMQGSYAGSVASLHAELGEPRFDEIFLARDFCGEGSPLIGNAYPDARKYAYGDSFGLIADRTQFGDFDRRRPLRSILSICKKQARLTLLGGHRRFGFDAAVLSLPLDMSRGEIDGVPLIVPSRQHVQATVLAIAEAQVDLRNYLRFLLAFAGNSPCHLILLSNLSGSGLMSEKNEAAMYVDIIRSLAAAGDAVLLKVHPRSSTQVLETVVAEIGNTFRVKVIDNASLARIPVELWTDLIAASNVVAMFSTGAVNIKYIHDREVALPLSDGLVERYIYPEKVSYIKGINTMIDQAMAALDNWDGKSVLWKQYS